MNSAITEAAGKILLGMLLQVYLRRNNKASQAPPVLQGWRLRPSPKSTLSYA